MESMMPKMLSSYFFFQGLPFFWLEHIMLISVISFIDDHFYIVHIIQENVYKL